MKAAVRYPRFENISAMWRSEGPEARPRAIGERVGAGDRADAERDRQRELGEGTGKVDTSCRHPPQVGCEFGGEVVGTERVDAHDDHVRPVDETTEPGTPRVPGSTEFMLHSQAE